MTTTIEIYIDDAEKAFQLTLEEGAVVQDVLDYVPEGYTVYDDDEEDITWRGTEVEFITATERRTLRAKPPPPPSSPALLETGCGCHCSRHCAEVDVDDCGCGCRQCHENKKIMRVRNQHTRTRALFGRVMESFI